MAAMERAQFLRITSVAGAGLALGVALPAATKPAMAAVDGPTGPASTALSNGGFSPNAWVTIAPDDTVTVAVSKSEMGQGVATGFPTIVADELDVPFERVKIVFAAGPAYIDATFGDQTTGGSTSMADSYTTLRQAGATARAMLVAAAAQQWNVDPTSLTTANGAVVHAASQRTATYGSLALAAAKLDVPKDVPLKDPSNFKLIGKFDRRIDVADKSRGRTQYGIDVRVPGMVYAAVRRPPVVGGSVAHFDPAPAMKVHGVQHVVKISSGVAVVASNSWAALQGAKAVHVAFVDGPNAKASSASLYAELTQAAKRKGAVAKSVGDPASVTGKTLTAAFTGPLVAHAAMEPRNATADVRADKVELWVPTQVQTRAAMTAAKIAGVPQANVVVHTTYLGGGYGGRLDLPEIGEAVEISKAIGKPVKVQWSREDDLQHDFYRTASVNVLTGTLADGKLAAMTHTIAASSVAKRWLPFLYKNGLDPTAVAGVADAPYEIPNLLASYVDVDGPVPVGFLRAPAANFNTFALESFMDELAHASGADPVAFRMALLDKSPRAAAVLKLASEQAGWGKPQAAGIKQGVALCIWGGSYGALVADVSMNGKTPRVHRVTFALDCGTVINPDIVVAQAQGAINYGLSMTLSSKITLEQGRVQQNNFYDFLVLKLPDAPREMAIHIVPSTEKPTGIGELGTPPIAPAVANAVFALTGKRARTLPLADALG